VTVWLKDVEVLAVAIFALLFTTFTHLFLDGNPLKPQLAVLRFEREISHCCFLLDLLAVM
jgi:hypothetical protein